MQSKKAKTCTVKVPTKNPWEPMGNTSQHESSPLVMKDHGVPARWDVRTGKGGHFCYACDDCKEKQMKRGGDLKFIELET